ncbi:MAG: hypothetical protein JNL38_19320 [Myxococcales bacterium]|nr:hypothetical protein [Myxococcales bacterium]
MSARVRLVAVVVLGLVGALAVLYVRLDREGSRALVLSDEAYARGERVEAIGLARAAAECRPTGASAAGFDRLKKIADESEKRGDDATAAAALRATRAAAIANGDGARRDRAGERLTALGARQADKDRAAAAGGAGRTSDERVSALLARPIGPRGVGALLLALGVVVFGAAALRLVGATTAKAKAIGWKLPAAVATAGAVLSALGALLA